MNPFSQSKIKTKLFSGFALVAVLAAAIGIVGDINMKMLDERDGSLFAKATISLHSLGNASSKFHELVLLNQKLRTDNAPESFMAASDGLAGRREAIEREVRQFTSVLADSASRAAVEALSDACQKYVSDSKAYYQLGMDGDLFEAKKFHRVVLGADNNAVSEAFMKMTDANVAETRQGREENSDIFESMRTLMFILVGTAIAAALGLGVYLTYLLGKYFLQQDGFMMPAAAPAFAGASATESSVAKVTPVICDALPAAKTRKSAPAKPAVSALPQTAGLSVQQDPNSALASAAAAQPAKKVKLFFDDTVNYVESDSNNYR